MNYTCTHDQNRMKVCAPCGKKIILNGKKLNFFQITNTHESRIQSYVNSNYSKVDSKFPNSICNSCRITLSEYEKNNRSRPLPVMPNYSDIKLPKSTRNTGYVCNCYICLTAKSSMHTKPVLGRGHTRQFDVALLFNLIKLNDISFKFVSDFKLLLIVNGQQTTSTSFPCPYCFVSLSSLRNCEENHESCTLKTYGDLRHDYDKYCRLGKNKSLSKECNSTVNLPLFDEDDDMYVIKKCPIPELHVLQGFVNHLFWKGIVPLVGREKALLWPTKLNLIARNYFGDCFEGNACRTLLREADRLSDPDIYQEVGYFALVPFISSFKAMNKIVHGYFAARVIDSNNNLDSHLVTLIRELEVSLRSTDVRDTLKIHILLKHLPDCLQFLENNGLGLWSEQAGESVHREFRKTCELFKINSMKNDKYAENLKKAVVQFSSLNL